MPDQMEAFKLAERTGIRNRTMLIVLIIASIVGIESSLILYPYTIYKEGGCGGFGADSLRRCGGVQFPVLLVD